MDAESTYSQLTIQAVNLYNESGELKLSKQFDDKTTDVKIDVSSFKKGVYILKVSDGSYIETHRIIVK